MKAEALLTWGALEAMHVAVERVVSEGAAPQYACPDGEAPYGWAVYSNITCPACGEGAADQHVVPLTADTRGYECEVCGCSDPWYRWERKGTHPWN